MHPKQIARLLFVLLVSFLPAGAAFGQGGPADTLMVYKQVEGDDLVLHAFYPDGQHFSPLPAIVFYFGGGWNSGSVRQFYPHANYFSRLGMAAFVAEYRTRNSHGTTPFESVEDAMSSMRWIRSHAEALAVDPGRIAAAGGSAGGHLAAATALLDSLDAPGEDLSVSRRPDALVLFNPVVDNSPDGYGYNRIGERYRAFSPLHNVDAEAPPMTVFLGANDDLIPVETAVAFQKALQDAGVRCDLHLYGGQPHGFFNYRKGENPYYDETVQAAVAFLRSLAFID